MSTGFAFAHDSITTTSSLPRSQPFARTTPRTGRKLTPVDQERLAAREAIIRAKMKARAARKAEGVDSEIVRTMEKPDDGAGSRPATVSSDMTEPAKADGGDYSITRPAIHQDSILRRPSPTGRSTLKPLILASSASVSPRLSISRTKERPYSAITMGLGLPVALPSTAKAIMTEQVREESKQVNGVPRRKVMKRQPSALELKYQSPPESLYNSSGSLSASPSPDQKRISLRLLSPRTPNNGNCFSSSPTAITTPQSHSPSSNRTQTFTNFTSYASLYGSMSPRTPVSPSPYTGILTPTYTASSRDRVNKHVDPPFPTDTNDDDLVEREFRRMSMYLMDPYQRSPSSPSPVVRDGPSSRKARVSPVAGAATVDDRQRHVTVIAERGKRSDTSSCKKDNTLPNTSTLNALSTPGERKIAKRSVTPAFRTKTVGTSASVITGLYASGAADAGRRHGMEFSRDVDVPAPPVWTYRSQLGDTFQVLMRHGSRMMDVGRKASLHGNDKNLSSLLSRRPSSSLKSDIPLFPPPLVPLPPLPADVQCSTDPSSGKEKWSVDTHRSIVREGGVTFDGNRVNDNVSTLLFAERRRILGLLTSMYVACSSFKQRSTVLATDGTCFDDKKAHDEGDDDTPASAPARGEHGMEVHVPGIASPSVTTHFAAASIGRHEIRSVEAYGSSVTGAKTTSSMHDRSDSMISVYSMPDEVVLSNIVSRFPPPQARRSDEGLPSSQPACAQLASSDTITNLLEFFIGCSTPRKSSSSTSANPSFDEDLTCIDLKESFDRFDRDLALGRQRTRQSIASLGASSCGSVGGPSTPLISSRAFQDRNVMTSPEIRISAWDGAGLVGCYDYSIHRDDQHSIKGDLGVHGTAGRVHAPELWEFGRAGISGTSTGKGDRQESPEEIFQSVSVHHKPDIAPPQQKTLDATSDSSRSSISHHDVSEVSREVHARSSTRPLSLIAPSATDLADWGEPEVLGGSC
ncbi:hypothetical protein QFC22_003733 [Naganishia vaughanmartiniae]|uniref:Uncharacterized protein n=1 Tax=Naganishia vaughanmartiniae TaxID=1424756 RepID=A0ACC2X6G0_9TREE|nr:hypothetical protein QFC22_003733 [Naganishia vaughanmartiniae]